MQCLVSSIEDVSVGTTMGSGETVPAITVSVTGKVNSGGWKLPELAPYMYINIPKDGILDLDFLATAPAPGEMVTWAISLLKAQSIFAVPNWVVGVRVHGSANSVVAMIDGDAQKPGGPGAKTQADTLPVPWPFPWWVDPRKYSTQ